MKYSIQMDSDHLCNIIAGTILSAFVEQDANAIMRCHVNLIGNTLIVSGSYTSFIDMDIETIVRPLVKNEMNIILAIENTMMIPINRAGIFAADHHSKGEVIAREIVQQFGRMHPSGSVRVLLEMEDEIIHRVHIFSSIAYMTDADIQLLLPGICCPFEYTYHEFDASGRDAHHAGFDEYQMERAGPLLARWVADSIVYSGICARARVQISFATEPIISSVWTTPHRDHLLSILQSEFCLSDWRGVIKKKEYLVPRFIHDFQFIE